VRREFPQVELWKGKRGALSTRQNNLRRGEFGAFARVGGRTVRFRLRFQILNVSCGPWAKSCSLGQRMVRWA
jgi:hypothetical protein